MIVVLIRRIINQKRTIMKMMEVMSVPRRIRFSPRMKVFLFMRNCLWRCEALVYAKPTRIQAACIALALTGQDICGSEITGSRKNAAFSLQTLERLLFWPKCVPPIRVLILTPTRELYAHLQISNVVR